MSNNTTIQTKKEFMQMIDKLMADDEVVVWTQNYNTVELKPKFNEKRVTLGFAADAFENKDGVGDLMHLNGHMLGVVICNRSILSEGAKKLVPIKQENTNEKANQQTQQD